MFSILSSLLIIVKLAQPPSVPTRSDDVLVYCHYDPAISRHIPHHASTRCQTSSSLQLFSLIIRIWMFTLDSVYNSSCLYISFYSLLAYSDICCLLSSSSDNSFLGWNKKIRLAHLTLLQTGNGSALSPWPPLAPLGPPRPNHNFTATVTYRNNIMSSAEFAMVVAPLYISSTDDLTICSSVDTWHQTATSPGTLSAAFSTKAQ